MFAMRNNKVIEVNPVKLSNRGTAMWCIPMGQKTKILINKEKLFDKRESAVSKMMEIRNHETKVRERQEKEYKQWQEKMLNLVYRILNEFDVKIPMICWSFMEYEELEQIYKELKQKNCTGGREGILNR